MYTEIKPLKPGQRVPCRSADLVVGENLIELKESSAFLGDPLALRETLDQEGFLFFRGFFERSDVLAGRDEILRKVREDGGLAEGTPMEHGIRSPEARENYSFGPKAFRNFPAYLALVNEGRIRRFFEEFLGGAIATYDQKWIRVVGDAKGTGAHYDIVYMRGGTENLYTSWIPLTDISLAMGPLVVCPGSHRIEELRASYGTVDAHEESRPAIFTRDFPAFTERYGLPWATANFNAGDLILFGMYFLHGSLPNSSDRFRISSDTRYQLASEPIDDRHMGDYQKKLATHKTGANQSEWLAPIEA